MITAKEARKLAKVAKDNGLKEFKESMYAEIEEEAKLGRSVAEIYFDVNDESQLDRANQVKAELIRNGFVANVYRNTCSSHYGQSGILRANW